MAKNRSFCSSGHGKEQESFVLRAQRAGRLAIFFFFFFEFEDGLHPSGLGDLARQERPQ